MDVCPRGLRHTVEGDGLQLHRLPLNVHQFDETAGRHAMGSSTAMHGAAVRDVNSVIHVSIDKGGDYSGAENRSVDALDARCGM